jgi:hypothetical protein
MKKESKNWVIIPDRNIIRYGKIARQQREIYKLDRNSAALIKCEYCDKPITVNEKEYKEKWAICLRKAQVEKDENDGYSFRTRIEFYCPDCQVTSEEVKARRI